MAEALIQALQAEVDRLWPRTGLPGRCLVTTESWDDGSVHVEIVDGLYDFVGRERGRETYRKRGLSLRAAARRCLHAQASAHALSMELKNRRADPRAPLLPSGLQDSGYSRWNWMAPTIEAMGAISNDFGIWTAAYYVGVLRRAPLDAHEKRNARWPIPSSLA